MGVGAERRFGEFGHKVVVGFALVLRVAQQHPERDDRRRELEVEVFTANALGRAFYARYGFELVEEKIHEPTGLEVMRLSLATTTPLEPTGSDGG